MSASGTAVKVAFSLFGVACLALSGVTAYNYARTMEAFTVVQLVPVELSVFVGDALASVNVTYRVDNPSKIPIELLWGEAGIFMHDAGAEVEIYQYDNFDPDEWVLEPGESREFNWGGYFKNDAVEGESFRALANRSDKSTWYAVCSLCYKAADYEFSSHIFYGDCPVREVSDG